MRRAVRSLLLAAFLVTTGVSSSQLALFGLHLAAGSSPARSVSSVPGLARALGISPHHHTNPPHTPSVVSRRRSARPAVHLAVAVASQALTLGATNLVAGDAATRTFEVENVGNVAFHTLTLQVAKTGSLPHHLGLAITTRDTRVFAGPVDRLVSVPVVVPVDLRPGETERFIVVYRLGVGAVRQRLGGSLVWVIVAGGAR